MSRTAILAPLAVLLAQAVAQNSNSDAGCGSQLQYFTNNQAYCCPGAVYGEGDQAYCCIGADFNVAGPTFASCFPTCSGSDGVTVTSTTMESCSATVYITDSDYSSKVSAAAVTIPTLASDFSGSAAAAAPTNTGSGSDGSSFATTVTSGSEITSTVGPASGSGSGSSSSSSSSSSGGAGARITSGPMVGAMMVAGGILLAA